MSRRWRYPRNRRGVFYPVTPAAAAAPVAPYVPVMQEPSGRNTRLAAFRARRRWSHRPIPTVPVVGYPRRGVLRVAAVRRGKFLSVPFTVAAATMAPWISPGVAAHRAPPRPVRRGRYFPVPVVGVAPAAAPWIPPSTDTRRTPPRTTRRGRYFPTPLVGVAPPPPTVVPQLPRHPARLWATRRARYWNAPPSPPAGPGPTWTPVFVRARRPLTGVVRRGDFQQVPSVARCPNRIMSRRPGLPLSRRPRRWQSPIQASAPTAVPLVARISTRRARCLPTRRGVFIEPAWPAIPAAAYAPLTDPVSAVRPNPATASLRANAGTAAVRPNLAEVST